MQSQARSQLIVVLMVSRRTLPLISPRTTRLALPQTILLQAALPRTGLLWAALPGAALLLAAFLLAALLLAALLLAALPGAALLLAALLWAALLLAAPSLKALRKVVLHLNGDQVPFIRTALRKVALPINGDQVPLIRKALRKVVLLNGARLTLPGTALLANQRKINTTKTASTRIKNGMSTSPLQSFTFSNKPSESDSDDDGFSCIEEWRIWQEFTRKGRHPDYLIEKYSPSLLC
jgi:hypothetical protein